MEITKKNIEEQAKKWSTGKYKEKREQDLRSWRLNGDNPGSTMRNKREQESQDGAGRRKRRKYKLMEQDWGTMEQGDLNTEEQDEQGAIHCAPREPELPSNPSVREQELPLKELKQARITMFMPVAPPKASPIPTSEKLQERDQEKGGGTERCEHYNIDEPGLYKDRGEYFGRNYEDEAVEGGGLRVNNSTEGNNKKMKEDVPDNLQYKETTKEEREITPSVEQQEEKAVVCVGTKQGQCETHGCDGEFVKISSKKWRDRGKGRGYGYVQTKVRKFICRYKKSNPSTSTVNPKDRFRDDPARDDSIDNSWMKGKSEHVEED